MTSHQVMPIFPHLLDLLHALRDDDVRLILAGGLGLALKREEVARRIRTGVRTLRQDFPEARSTNDMDQFLQAGFFADPAQGARLREVLRALGYRPTASYYQFRKEVDGAGGVVRIGIDLMARTPDVHEAARVKKNDVRVTTTLPRPPEHAIHGYHTPEAFAIDRSPMMLQVEGTRSGGGRWIADVWLPHPFASLMMKLKATLDRVKTPQSERKPRSEKHAHDVYLILAMMMEDEWPETCNLAREYAEEPILRELREAQVDLFGLDSAPGCQDILVSHRAGGGDRGEIDLAWLRGGLREVLG